MLLEDSHRQSVGADRGLPRTGRRHVLRERPERRRRPRRHDALGALAGAGARARLGRRDHRERRGAARGVGRPLADRAGVPDGRRAHLQHADGARGHRQRHAPAAPVDRLPLPARRRARRRALGEGRPTASRRSATASRRSAGRSADAAPTARPDRARGVGDRLRRVADRRRLGRGGRGRRDGDAARGRRRGRDVLRHRRRLRRRPLGAARSGACCASATGSRWRRRWAGAWTRRSRTTRPSTSGNGTTARARTSASRRSTSCSCTARRPTSTTTRRSSRTSTRWSPRGGSPPTASASSGSRRR